MAISTEVPSEEAHASEVVQEWWQERAWTVWFWLLLPIPVIAPIVCLVLAHKKIKVAEKANAPVLKYEIPALIQLVVLLVSVLGVVALAVGAVKLPTGDLQNNLVGNTSSGQTVVTSAPGVAGSAETPIPAGWTPSCATKSDEGVSTTVPVQLPPESGLEPPADALNTALVVLTRAYQTGNDAYLSSYEFGASSDSTLQEQIGGYCYDSITVVGTPTFTSVQYSEPLYHVVATVQFGNSTPQTFDHYLQWWPNDGYAAADTGVSGWWLIEGEPN